MMLGVGTPHVLFQCDVELATWALQMGAGQMNFNSILNMA